MPLDIVIGAQWGDEGKGRVVDLLADTSDLVARVNGGDNAGHTVTVGEKIYKLHLIPSGIIHPNTTGVMGSGMVLNPMTLVEEIAMLREAGVNISPERLWISDAAHLITPLHRLLDRVKDAALGSGQIGTTGRGIGPAYADKAARRGLRAGEILDSTGFEERVRDHFHEVGRQLMDWYGQPANDLDEMMTDFLEKARQLRPYIRRIGSMVRAALASDKVILVEGAQGTLLDIDQGTYPYVTSSFTTAGGVPNALGVGLHPARKIIGVVKAFQTRVGAGPFPTELEGDIAGHLRGTGKNPWDEFGTTTGRPRRVGWLDLVLLRYAHEVNGFTELFITKLDVLSGLEEIRVCARYRRNNREMASLDFSGDARLLSGCEPLFETLPGWEVDLRGCRAMEDLPEAARTYIRFIEDQVQIPVKYISVGPERTDLMMRE
jgi:adenylosuccinate synthase